MVSVNSTGNVSNNGFGFEIHKQPEQAPAKINVPIGQPTAKTEGPTGDMEAYLAEQGRQIREDLGLNISKNTNITEVRQLAQQVTMDGVDKTLLNRYIQNAPYERIKDGVNRTGEVLANIGTRGNIEAGMQSPFMQSLDKFFT